MKHLDGLVASGNTIVVVEHDMDMPAASDWIIDIGPGNARCARLNNQRTLETFLNSGRSRALHLTSERTLDEEMIFPSIENALSAWLHPVHDADRDAGGATVTDKRFE